MISVELKVVGGKHAGQTIPLDRKKFLIGREQDCQLRPNSELVSRHHCVFTVDDYSVRVRDLGSTNGTAVNGETIRKEVVLQQGDQVTVGSLEFVVAINEVDSAPKTEQVSADTKETVVAGTETLSEMTPIKPGEDVIASAPEEQQTEAAPPEQTPAEPSPAEPAQPAAETQQPVSNGDTTVIAQPAILPGQVPYQPGMPQQMGQMPMYGAQPYPGMPGQMPMPQMPGQPYPQQPYPQPQYPQQQPFPQQPFPQQAYPQQQQPFPQQPAPVAVAPAPQPAAAVSESPAEGAADVSLPDPSTTGFKEPPPKPPEPETPVAEGETAESQEKSNQTADAIIKQYMQKRPGG